MYRIIRREVDKKPGSLKKGVTWSQKQRYQAVVLYKALGSLREVAKQTGIPYATIKLWHSKDWWKEYEEDIRQQGRSALSGKLAKIIEKSYVQLEDRLENGDIVWNPATQEFTRKPLGGHTVNQIAKDSFDRAVMMEKLMKEDKVTVTEEKVTDMLQRLGEDFIKFAKAKEIKSSPQFESEVKGGDPASTPALIAEFSSEEDQNAVHDERKTGLQEGKREIQVETGADQGPSGPESSPSGDDQGR